MKDLQGKAVLITGAASGIGRATAMAFAHKGANPVILIDINPQGLSETASELERIGSSPVPYTIDVTDFEAINAMMNEVIERFGRIDVLVNVAGVSLVCPVEKLELADWERVLNVDLWGVINTIFDYRKVSNASSALVASSLANELMALDSEYTLLARFSMREQRSAKSASYCCLLAPFQSYVYSLETVLKRLSSSSMAPAAFPSWYGKLSNAERSNPGDISLPTSPCRQMPAIGLGFQLVGSFFHVTTILSSAHELRQLALQFFPGSHTAVD